MANTRKSVGASSSKTHSQLDPAESPEEAENRATAIIPVPESSPVHVPVKLLGDSLTPAMFSNIRLRRLCDATTLCSPYWGHQASHLCPYECRHNAAVMPW